jgi:hypothetical protein
MTFEETPVERIEKQLSASFIKLLFRCSMTQNSPLALGNWESFVLAALKPLSGALRSL